MKLLSFEKFVDLILLIGYCLFAPIIGTIGVWMVCWYILTTEIFNER